MTTPDPDEIQRSEKVRRLLDERLPWILRHGTALVLLLFLIAAILLAFLPYPHGDGESILTHFRR